MSTWDEPASACLSSRIPYGSEVTDEKLRQIERAEDAVRALGFRVFRVRHHDSLARLEIARDEMPRALEPVVNERLVAGVKAPATSSSASTCRATGWAASTRRCGCDPSRDPVPRAGRARPRRRPGAPAVSCRVARRHRLGELRARRPRFRRRRHRPHPPGYPVYIGSAKWWPPSSAALPAGRRRVGDRSAGRCRSCRCWRRWSRQSSSVSRVRVR